MASSAMVTKQRIRQRRGPVRLVDPKGEKIPEAVLIEASDRFRQRSDQIRMSRRVQRVEALPPQRRSVERAMLAVEEKFVKAMWVLHRAVTEDGWNYYPSRHGIDYLIERVDHFMAGDWQHVVPRPAIPEGKHIDEATRIQGWLSYLEPTHARVLTVGAMSKCGDAGRRINWIRVRARLRELDGLTDRHLRRIYSEALRILVAELTQRQVENLTLA